MQSECRPYFWSTSKLQWGVSRVCARQCQLDVCICKTSLEDVGRPPSLNFGFFFRVQLPVRFLTVWLGPNFSTPRPPLYIFGCWSKYKVGILIGMWNSRPPPTLWKKNILKFHFDYWIISLRQDPECCSMHCRFSSLLPCECTNWIWADARHLDIARFFHVWTSEKHLGQAQMCPHTDWEILLEMPQMSCTLSCFQP